MVPLLLSLVALISHWGEVPSGEDNRLPPPIPIYDKLQVFYLKNNCFYTVQRMQIPLRDGTVYWTAAGGTLEGKVNKEMRVALPLLRLYKAPLSKMGEPRCFEIQDAAAIITSTIFLRWRLTPSDYFWGTERSIDDQLTGIFRLPLRILKPFEVNKDVSRNLCPTNPRWGSLHNYMGGDDRIGLIRNLYWFSSGQGRDANDGLLPLTHTNWPKGSKGIYFDFVPMTDEQKTLLFILFDSQHLEFSSDPRFRDQRLKLYNDPLSKFKYKNSIMEIWECEKGSKDKHLKDGTFDGTQELFDSFEGGPVKDLKKGWIDTTMADPFYAFEKDGDYFFATITGKIFIAPRPPAVAPKAIDRLVKQLDSDTFADRDKASRELRAMGKPAQGILESHLSKSTSPEQKRRLTDLIKAVKDQPHRKTRLLWDHAKLPVYRLLFDMDHRKIYAITKPDAVKLQYFFEIQDKPQLRFLILPKESKAPSSLPDSARLFYDFARSLQNEK